MSAKVTAKIERAGYIGYELEGVMAARWVSAVQPLLMLFTILGVSTFCYAATMKVRLIRLESFPSWHCYSRSGSCGWHGGGTLYNGGDTESRPRSV